MVVITPGVPLIPSALSGVMLNSSVMLEMKRVMLLTVLPFCMAQRGKADDSVQESN